VAHEAIAECVPDVLTTFWCLLWSIIEQMYSNMESTGMYTFIYLVFLTLFQLQLLFFVSSVFQYSNCSRKIYGVILQHNFVYSEHSNVQATNIWNWRWHRNVKTCFVKCKMLLPFSKSLLLCCFYYLFCITKNLWCHLCLSSNHRSFKVRSNWNARIIWHIT